MSIKWNYQTLQDISVPDYQYRIYWHICELTCIERVSPAFQTFYWHRKCCSISPAFVPVTRPKTAVLKLFQFIYLAILLTHYLCSNDNLEVTVWYQKFGSLWFFLLNFWNFLYKLVNKALNSCNSAFRNLTKNKF